MAALKPMKFVWVVPLLACATLTLAADEAGGIYFPQRSVELTLLVDSQSRKVLPSPEGSPLFRPRVLLDNGSAPTNLRFELSSLQVPVKLPPLPWLHLDVKTGELSVKEYRVLEDTGSPKTFVLWLEVQVRTARHPLHRSARPFMAAPTFARMNLTLTLALRKNDSCTADGVCAAECVDTCFWNNADYQVWENLPATPLGLIGNPRPGHRCEQPVGYRLVNGSEHAEIRKAEDGSWQLWAQSELDRDRLYVPGTVRGPGPQLLLDVECTTSKGSQRKTLRVFVLDEDDNPPIPEPGPRVEFTFDSEAALQRGAHLVVRDLDSRGVNRYSNLHLRDPSGLVTHNKLEFDVAHAGVPHTLISIRLQLKEAVDERYPVQLGITDLTLKPGMEKEMKLNVTLWGPPLGPPVAMPAGRLVPTDPTTDAPGDSYTGATADSTTDAPGDRSTDAPASASPRTRRGVNFVAPRFDSGPHKLSLRARPYARITQASGNLTNFRFDVAPGEGEHYFNITSSEGILFLTPDGKRNAGEKSGTIDVSVQATLIPPEPSKHQVIHLYHVHVVLGEQGSPKECKSTTHCADFNNDSACEAACGLGTGGPTANGTFGCFWRGELAHSDQYQMTRKYATCSPDLKFCPDGTCDELERMHHLLCPQDCTGNVDPPKLRKP